MKIKISKFGKILISRPAGKEAFLSASAYILPKKNEKIVLDFSDVEVLSPSWADEFVTKLREKYKNNLSFINIKNASVVESLKIIQP